MRRPTIAILAAVLLSGCAGDGSQRGEEPPQTTMPPPPPPPSGAQPDPTAAAAGADSDHATPAWPFWPRSMRIHPSTRLATDQESSLEVIEARLEFRDQQGHVCKAVGALELALVDARGGRDGAPAASWALDLDGQEQNLRHFDEITRTYLLRLKLDGIALPQSAALSVTFHAADGVVMTHQSPLRQARPR